MSLPLIGHGEIVTLGSPEKESLFLYTMTDKALSCADCDAEFVFTASEQDFYAQRQFSEPRRCPSCRAARKLSRGGSGDPARSGE